jgi:hypothetical protein
MRLRVLKERLFVVPSAMSNEKKEQTVKALAEA